MILTGVTILGAPLGTAAGVGSQVEWSYARVVDCADRSKWIALTSIAGHILRHCWPVHSVLRRWWCAYDGRCGGTLIISDDEPFTSMCTAQHVNSAMRYTESAQVKVLPSFCPLCIHIRVSQVAPEEESTQPTATSPAGWVGGLPMDGKGKKEPSHHHVPSPFPTYTFVSLVPTIQARAEKSWRGTRGLESKG